VTRLSLRPGPRAGLEIADARSWRIDATSGGGVVVRGPRTDDRVVATPGQVARVVVLRGPQVPKKLAHFAGFDEVLALLSDDAALLVVPLHLLAHGNVADASELRRVSGVDDFAQALGLTLEPATDAEAALVAAADGAVLAGPARASLRPVTIRQWALLAVAVLAAVGTLVLSGDSALVAGAVAALATLVLAVDQWRYRARFLTLVQPPAGGTRTTVPNQLGPEHPQGVREARLQIGPDDVVHVVRGTETWVAGPRLGGVVRCSIGTDVIRFVDRRGAELLVLGTASWAAQDDSALTDACRGAGIEVVSERGAGRPRPEADQVLAVETTDPAHDPAMTTAALGDFVFAGPFATSLIALFILWTHAFPLDDLDAPRGAVAAVAAVAVVVSAAAQLRLRAWTRHQTRAGGR
jgi:hypothetical protein